MACRRCGVSQRPVSQLPSPGAHAGLLHATHICRFVSVCIACPERSCKAVVTMGKGGAGCAPPPHDASVGALPGPMTAHLPLVRAPRSPDLGMRTPGTPGPSMPGPTTRQRGFYSEILDAEMDEE